MNTHAVSFRKIALPLVALPLAFVPLAGIADEVSAEGSAPVQTLKSSLPSTMGFKVDKVHMTDAGVACIKYRLANNTGGERRAMAVVEGDKVLRSTSGTTDFEKAWNSKCAASRTAAN